MAAGCATGCGGAGSDGWENQSQTPGLASPNVDACQQTGLVLCRSITGGIEKRQ